MPYISSTLNAFNKNPQTPMFNNFTHTLLILISFTYIVQTLLLFISLALYTNKTYNINSCDSFLVKNNLVKTLLLFLLLSYSGLPPFFVFFFKILLLLKLNTISWVLIVYLIINSAAVYYYLNFITNLLKAKPTLYDVKRNITEIQLIYITLHTIFFNLISFLLLQYFYILSI